MTCVTCGEDGAGLRYRGRGFRLKPLWFHAMCWKRARNLDPRVYRLTATGENADNRGAETTALTVAPANPLPAQWD